MDDTNRQPWPRATALLFLGYMATISALHGQLEKLAAPSFQFLVAIGAVIAAGYHFVTFFWGRLSNRNRHRAECRLTALAFAGGLVWIGVCLYRTATLERLEVAGHVDFTHLQPTAHQMETGERQPTPAHDLLLWASQLALPITKDSHRLFGDASADIDIRGGRAEEAVTLQSAELRVRWVGDPVPVEMQNLKVGNGKRVISYDFYVDGLAAGEATVPYCVVVDEDSKASDRTSPRRPVVKRGEEATVRVGMAFREPGQYEVDVYVTARLWPAGDKPVKLTPTPIRVLVVDGRHVRHVLYTPDGAGRVRKWNLAPVTKTENGVTRTEWQPLDTGLMFPDRRASFLPVGIVPVAAMPPATSLPAPHMPAVAPAAMP